MKLYLIINNTNQSGKDSQTLEFFKSASKTTNTEIVIIDPLNFDADILNEVTPEDAVFACATGKRANIVEWFFLEKGLKNFHRSPLSEVIGHYINPAFIFKDKISIPKTEFTAANDKSLLIKQVEKLGGFPLVIRVSATSGGTGVIKVDSFEGLLSTIQYLKNQKKTFILREYIEHKIYGRLIVLGDKVIASKTNTIPEGDFRANDGEPTSFRFSDEINLEAVKATHLRGVNFGGADVIVDKNGKFYITEVNYPCSFISTQEVSGVDIASEIINFLMNS